MDTIDALNPAVRRVQLGIILRLLRERSGLKPKEVAPALDWYIAKVTKLEKGYVTISAAEIDRLIELYGVEAEEAAKIRALCAEARKRDRPCRVPDWAQTYIALETAAAEVKVYDAELVPGMMQTEHYARALLSLSVANTPDEVEARVVERTQRGRRLHAPEPPALRVVLGEAALRREVGGPEAHRDQLEHLVKLGQLAHVTIQVLPFRTGEHVAMGSSFKLLHLADPEADFVYLEGLTDASYLDRPGHTSVYSTVFTRLQESALGEDDSARMIERRIAELP